MWSIMWNKFIWALEMDSLTISKVFWSSCAWVIVVELPSIDGESYRWFMLDILFFLGICSTPSSVSESVNEFLAWGEDGRESAFIRFISAFTRVSNGDSYPGNIIWKIYLNGKIAINLETWLLTLKHND